MSDSTLVVLDDSGRPAFRASSVDSTPDRDIDRSISHLLSTAEANAGHLDVHTAAARAAKDPPLLAHHLHHAADHAMEVADHLGKLRAAVTRRVPSVAQELAGLDQAIPGTRAIEHVPRAALDMSIAHDLASAQAATAHVSRHLSAAQSAQAAGNAVSVTFNIEHAVHHIAEISHSLSELDEDLPRRLPSVGAENLKLHAAMAPSGTGKVTPGRSAPGDYDVTEWRAGPEPA